MDRVEDVGYIVNPSSVAVIGGGYAGMAAAIKLAELGVNCVVFEAAKVLGGRARKVEYRDTTLDNGQHILSGAYTELLRMMALVGVPDSAFQRLPLRLDMDETFSLRAPNLPAPLHLAWALLAAKGLNWRERFAAIRLIQSLKKSSFKVDSNETVADLLATFSFYLDCFVICFPVQCRVNVGIQLYIFEFFARIFFDRRESINLFAACAVEKFKTLRNRFAERGHRGRHL